MTFEKMTFVHEFYNNRNIFSEEQKERVFILFSKIRPNIDE